MAWKAEWDGEFLTGGERRLRLTPNFRLGEFRQPDGSVRVHRELVSALQMLRDRFGRSTSIKQVDDNGLGAVVAGDPVGDLLAAADGLEAHHLFALAEQADGKVRVRIPDPDNLPEIGLEPVLESAFTVTSAYETGGVDPFEQVTGNFDGAGLSFGPAQVNFKTETLQPLFRKFEKADPAAYRGCFGEDFDEWQEVMDSSVNEQIDWANSKSTGNRNQLVIEPWTSHLRAVGKVGEFRAILVEHVLRNYGAKLLRAIGYLKKVKPDVQIDHLRCVCSLYDLVIQQGSLDKADEEIRQRVASENPTDQFELVRIAVEERGKKASERWRADCISRRVGILQGLPTTVEESGQEAQRTNIFSYRLRNVRIRNAAGLMDTNVDQQLADASKALASGKSILV